jgi:hypothetical protein
MPGMLGKIASGKPKTMIEWIHVQEGGFARLEGTEEDIDEAMGLIEDEMMFHDWVDRVRDETDCTIDLQP